MLCSEMLQYEFYGTKVALLMFYVTLIWMLLGGKWDINTKDTKLMNQLKMFGGKTIMRTKKRKIC